VFRTAGELPKLVSPLSNLLGGWIGHTVLLHVNYCKNAWIRRQVPVTKSSPARRRRVRAYQDTSGAGCVALAAALNPRFGTPPSPPSPSSDIFLEHDIHVFRDGD